MKNLIYSSQALLITLVGFLTGDTRSTLFAFDIFSQKSDLLVARMRQYRVKKDALRTDFGISLHKIVVYVQIFFKIAKRITNTHELKIKTPSVMLSA